MTDKKEITNENVKEISQPDNNGIITNDSVKSENINQNITSDDVKKEKYNGKNNLISLADRTTTEQQEIARKGGIASGESRRKKRDAKNLLTEILNRTISDSNIDEILGDSKALLGDDKTAYNVLLVKLLQVAMQGNTTAIQLVRDTVGDKPIDRQEITADVMTDADRKLIDNVRRRLLG